MAFGEWRRNRWGWLRFYAFAIAFLRFGFGRPDLQLDLDDSDELLSGFVRVVAVAFVVAGDVGVAVAAVDVVVF